MKSARELLIDAVEEQRPIILILGQDAWIEPGFDDPILVKALDRLGHRSQLQKGWSGLLGTTQVADDFYGWLADRFERRVPPAWLSMLSELPWSAVFTSALDPTLKVLLEGGGREPEVVLTASETPRATRSRVRPPLYYLFGCAGSLDPQTSPPTDRQKFHTRRIHHAMPILNRIMDTATTLGLLVVEGFMPGRDWLKIEDILGAAGQSVPEQILWFGGQPQLESEEEEVDFLAAVSSRRIVLEQACLGTILAELHSTGRLRDFMQPESQEAGVISFTNNRYLHTTPEQRLRVEAVSTIVDDAWTAFLSPLGPDAEYDSFRRFHGGLGGPRLLVEGVRRGFAIERDFENKLLRRVTATLTDHANINIPIIVHGQSGTGKSVALARVVAQVRSEKTAAVLYGVGRIPQPQEISGFCEEAEKAGAEATLIVCDANRDVDSYRDLLMRMRSLGRRVVVLGSRYRLADSIDKENDFNLEAPTTLSQRERKKIISLFEYFFSEKLNPETVVDVNILAFLYRFLPPSRARIATGLSGEARAAEQELRTRGRRIKPSFPNTQLAYELIKAGIAQGYSNLFNDQQTDALESDDAAGRLIDLVMVAGSLNCSVPVNLLLRSVTESVTGTDIALIAKMFRELDLFRWKWADEEQNELLVLPRLVLEAELICRRRLGSPEKEADRLIDLISAVRNVGVDARHERQFLLNLLQQIGNDGFRGLRYQKSYIRVARSLTELRTHFGVTHASLMLQESTFRRMAVRVNQLDDEDRFPLLEEAREAVQTALDGIANGTIQAPKRTQKNLQVEHASIYGFLAYDRAKRRASSTEIWSSYQAARNAIRKAVSVMDNYYPLDVGLWTPADILKTATLSKLQQAEIEADIYATMDQVDPDALSPRQREKFDVRRMSVGTILQNQKLTEEAYHALEENGSTAGYFIRARELAPRLNPDMGEISKADDLLRAKHAADFLHGHFDKIEHDERCLSLLLECRWIAEMGRRPLRGQRQPLPRGETARRDLLTVVRTLNQASGDTARPATRYLEAVLAWVIGHGRDAFQIFRELSRETEYENSSRVVRRHVVTNSKGETCSFQGRVEKRRTEGHWVVRVDGVEQTVDLLSRDFPHEDISYGRHLKKFAIAFNFIGPIADPFGRRR